MTYSLIQPPRVSGWVIQGPYHVQELLEECGRGRGMGEERPSRSCGAGEWGERSGLGSGLPGEPGLQRYKRVEDAKAPIWKLLTAVEKRL